MDYQYRVYVKNNPQSEWYSICVCEKPEYVCIVISALLSNTHTPPTDIRVEPIAVSH